MASNAAGGRGAGRGVGAGRGRGANAPAARPMEGSMDPRGRNTGRAGAQENKPPSYVQESLQAASSFKKLVPLVIALSTSTAR